MQLSNKIRFVHGNHDDIFFPRFTIAYHRDEDQIVFAWTNLYHTDLYVKSEGRNVASTRLLSAIQNGLGDINSHVAFDMTPISNGTSVVGYGNDKAKVGVLPASNFKHILSDMISDHVLDEMTLMDFKHAFISNVLFEIIHDTNKAATY